MWCRISLPLQHTTHHCNTVQQRTATHCNALQRTAMHYNTLQHTATHCNKYTLKQTPFPRQNGENVLHTAMNGNTLQHTATRCSKYTLNKHHSLVRMESASRTLQDGSANCNTPSHTATHCHTLQHTTAHRNNMWFACLAGIMAMHFYDTLQHPVTHCNTLQQHVMCICCMY